MYLFRDIARFHCLEIKETGLSSKILNGPLSGVVCKGNILILSNNQRVSDVSQNFVISSARQSSSNH